jgi:hypothetical protein
MKVGDLVRDKRLWGDKCALAFVLYVNEKGGTIKALFSSGDIGWIVMSACEVVNETR